MEEGSLETKEVEKLTYERQSRQRQGGGATERALPVWPFQ